MQSYMNIWYEPAAFDRIRVEAAEILPATKPVITMKFDQPLGEGPDGSLDYIRVVALHLTREQLQEIVNQGQDALAQYDALVPIIAAKREVEAGGEKVMS